MSHDARYYQGIDDKGLYVEVSANEHGGVVRLGLQTAQLADPHALRDLAASINRAADMIEGLRKAS